MSEEKKQKPVSEMNELELYFLIDFVGAFTWRMNHDMAHGRIPVADHAAIDADIIRLREEQIAAIKELPRFGVVPFVEGKERPTEAYWTWYRTWDGWKKDMTDEQWNAFNAATKDGVTTEQVANYKKEAFKETTDAMVVDQTVGRTAE